MKVRYLFPLILFLGIVLVLWRGMSLHPNEIPSPFINKAAPSFQLNTLFGPEKITTQKDLIGHVSLVNVWATWCYACTIEHTLLLDLAKKHAVFIYGLIYKDNPATAKKWLEKNGNPYNIVAVDADGSVAIDWGVYGTPETFVIDRHGIIRYKHIGMITAEIWEEKLSPLIAELGNEDK